MSEPEGTGVVEVTATDVGGIEETTVPLPPGVTVLVGRNATNRTSFLRAVMTALGSDAVSVRAGADTGQVSLTIDGRTYTRTLSRADGAVRYDGEPYLDDPAAADLFAFLLESNEARRAVERGEDLRERVVRPIDTDAIEAEIERRVAERREVDDRLRELEALAERREELAAGRERVAATLEATREELADHRAALADADADLSVSRAEQSELDDRLAELEDRRAALASVRHDRSAQQESIEALEDELADVVDALASLPDDVEAELSGLDDRIDGLRARRESLEATVTDLQRVIAVNEGALEGDGSVVASATREGAAGELPGKTGAAGDVTAALTPGGDRLTCWTCGSEVERERIETTVASLRDLRADAVDERAAIREELEELTAERDRLAGQRSRRERLERRRRELREEVGDRESRLERLSDREAELEAAVSELEAAAAETEDAALRKVLELHSAVNRAAYEVERLEREREELADELADVESALAERESLRERRKGIHDELTELRTRVERVEETAVESFNEHMAAVLSLLSYDNVDRIWLERLQREAMDGRRRAIESAFRLHVVREGDDGAVYEDDVEHLSESERAVVGLVFALAGYRTHDVDEVVPFMLLDSLEAIDADRIAALVEYVAEFAGHVLVALLPEDAAALPDEYNYVRDL